MAENKYVTKGYSTYTDIPAWRGGYDNGPNNPVNWYVVETTTVERIRTPTVVHTNFGGSPSKTELMKEFVRPPSMLTGPKYVPKEYHEGYEPNYGLGYENSSPPRYHGQDDIAEDFFNKVQIEASRPTKIGNFSSQNRSGPSNLNRYRPSSPNKYQSSSPNKYRPSSPNKYRPSSPNNSQSSSPNSSRPSSPNKYRPSSPNNYQPSSVNKYKPSSPNNHWPSSPNKYQPSSPNNYQPSSVNKYQPSSPNNHWPSSPNKYQPSSPNKYQPSSPNKYQPSSPSSEGARHVRIGNFSSPNNSWQSAGPSVTHHPLTTPTNDINEALSFFTESVNYSPHSGPKIRGGGGGIDDSSTHAQIIEPERRYTRSAFGNATTEPHYNSPKSEYIIDSKEAMKKYGGTFVPYAT